MSTATTPQLVTAEQLLERSAELPRCELIRGALKMMSPAGGRHGDLAFALGLQIGTYVNEHHLGKLYAAETGFLLERDPDSVRAPDIAFIAAYRADQANTPGYIPIPPDLAVEVNSPGDRAGDVAAKVQWWLTHGTKLVWVVDPKPQTVTAYHPGGSAHVYAAQDTLDGGDVLPGFAMPLASLFTG